MILLYAAFNVFDFKKYMAAGKLFNKIIYNNCYILPIYFSLMTIEKWQDDS